MSFPIFSDEKKRMFYVDMNGSLQCLKCSKYVNNGVIYVVCVWNHKKPSSKHLICSSCMRTTKFHGDVIQKFVVMVRDKYISGSVPVIFEPPRIEHSSKVPDVFSAAEIPTPRVVDRTRHAGRESFEGSLIGAPDILKQLEEKDAEDVFDVDGFLCGLNDAPTVLPDYVDKKLLEEER